jgi:hypothetical protein
MGALAATARAKPGHTKTEVVEAILRDAFLSNKKNLGPPTGSNFQALTEKLARQEKLTQTAIDLAVGWQEKYQEVERSFDGLKAEWFQWKSVQNEILEFFRVLKIFSLEATDVPEAERQTFLRMREEFWPKFWKAMRARRVEGKIQDV